MRTVALGPRGQEVRILRPENRGLYRSRLDVVCWGGWPVFETHEEKGGLGKGGLIRDVPVADKHKPLKFGESSVVLRFASVGPICEELGRVGEGTCVFATSYVVDSWISGRFIMDFEKNCEIALNMLATYFSPITLL